SPRSASQRSRHTAFTIVIVFSACCWDACRDGRLAQPNTVGPTRLAANRSLQLARVEGALVQPRPAQDHRLGIRQNARYRMAEGLYRATGDLRMVDVVRVHSNA